MIFRNFLLRSYLAEFLGTYALIFFGCGSMILNELNPSAISVDSIPIIFGLIITIMIYSFGNISGAHFNPVVSFAFYRNNDINIYELLYYIISQLLGAILASSCHKYFLGNQHSFGMTINKLTLTQGFLLEVLITAFLVLTIFCVAKEKSNSKLIAGLSIGSMVSVCSFVAGPFTGASMNPARSIGPALLAFDFNGILIYILGPLIGSFIGLQIYKILK